MLYQNLILKYTGVKIDQFDREDPVDRLIYAVANDIQQTEARLEFTAQNVVDAADKVLRAINAKPNEDGEITRVPSLNSLGELQSKGPDLDRLVGVRQVQIDHLVRLVQINYPQPTPTLAG